MNKNLPCLLMLILFGIINLNAQTNNSIKMKSYIPKSNAYDIYYPENYTVVDSQDIVSFHNMVTGLNITITDYVVDKNIDSKYLIALLNGFINEYFGKKLIESDWSVFKSKFDNLIEARFDNQGSQWIWWGISKKNHTVFISADKKKSINEDEIKLIRFMIDNLIIQ